MAQNITKHETVGRYEAFSVFAGSYAARQALLDTSTLDLPTELRSQGGAGFESQDVFEFDDTADLSWLWSQSAGSEFFSASNIVNE